jgi:DnaK suppressor protein
VPRKDKSNSDPKPGKKPRKAAAPKLASRAKTNKKPATARKRTSAPKPEPVRTKTYLNTRELAHFQHLLLTKRAELLGDVTSMENETLLKSRLSASGDLSTMPIHMADIGTANYEQEFALGLLDSERKLLLEINEALQRIEDKTYGICEGTGKEIVKARLEANPWARYCVEYARMVEQGLVKEGDEYVEEDDGDSIDDEDVLDEEDSDGDTDDSDTPDEPSLPDDDEEVDEELGWRDSKN